MPAQRPFKVFAVIATIAAAAMGLSAWLMARQTRELMNATSAAQTAKAALAEEQIRLQQAAAELSQSAQQAQEQASALQESIEDSEQYQRDQKQLGKRIGELSNGLTAASSVKVAMAEHYMAMGNWPASNQECGVPAPDSYKTDTLQSIAVEAGGRIKLVFEDAGTRRRLWLHASANPAGQISWRCISPDIADITQLVAACSYKPVAKPVTMSN